MDDLEKLFNDAVTIVQKAHPAIPLKRKRGSLRVKKYLESIDNYISRKDNNRFAGPMTFCDRVITGMFDERKQGGFGDKVLNGMMKVMNEFSNGYEPFTLRVDQRAIVSRVVAAMLPNIYGNNLEPNKKRLLNMLGVEEIREQVLILAQRRAGKTTCIANVSAAAMIEMPVVEIATIAVAQRASKRVMEATKLFLNMHPKGRKLLTQKPGGEKVISNHEQLKLIGDHPSHVKTFWAFPASSDVCFIYLFLYFLFYFIQKVCWFFFLFFFFIFSKRYVFFFFLFFLI